MAPSTVQQAGQTNVPIQVRIQRPKPETYPRDAGNTDKRPLKQPVFAGNEQRNQDGAGPIEKKVPRSQVHKMSGDNSP